MVNDMENVHAIAKREMHFSILANVRVLAITTTGTTTTATVRRV